MTPPTENLTQLNRWITENVASLTGALQRFSDDGRQLPAQREDFIGGPFPIEGAEDHDTCSCRI